MGFQSDVVLGFRGMKTIRELVSTFPNCPDVNDIEELDQFLYRELEGSNTKTREYLSKKYRVEIPDHYPLEDMGVYLLIDKDDGYEEEDYVYGVKLTDRYRPVFLDFENPHGGLDIKTLNKDFFEDIEAARKILIEDYKLDYMYNAEIFIRDHWY
jgi:hypothetical protein